MKKILLLLMLCVGTATLLRAAPQTLDVSAGSVILGQAVTFTGHASDPDGNLGQMNFYVTGPGLSGWNYVGSAPMSGSDSTASISWTPSEAGSYAVHIRAFNTNGEPDWNGNIAIEFTVNPANVSPQTNWAMGTDTIAGQATTLTGNATDPDGNLSHINFYVTGPGYSGWNHIGSASVSGSDGTASISWTPSEAGSYAVHIRAFDTSGEPDWNGNVAGNFSVSAAVPPDTTPPTTPAGLNAANVNANSCTVSWVASSDDVGVTAYEVRRIKGGQVVTQEVTSTAAAQTGLEGSSLYSITVRARDAAGNWSNWSNTIGVSTPSATAPAGANQSGWRDVNGDGIKDEIIGANSPRFSYSVTSWTTNYYHYLDYNPNDFWVGLNFNFSTWFGNDNFNWTNITWSASFYMYPSNEYTVTYSDIRYNMEVEAGYDYRLFVGPPNSANPSDWAPIPELPGVMNFTQSGSQAIFLPGRNHDLIYGKAFYFVRLGKPLGAMGIGGAGGTIFSTIPTGNYGTVTIPGLGTVNVSGFGTFLGGGSPVFSIKDTLDRIIHSGPEIIWNVWDMLTNTPLNIGGLSTELDFGVDLHGRFLVGAKLDDTNSVYFEINIKRPHFSKMWETKNPTNHVFNTTAKDDPNLDGTNAAARNLLYVVADPANGKLNVSVKVSGESDVLNNLYVAVFTEGGHWVQQPYLPDTLQHPSSEGTCTFSIEHPSNDPGASNFYRIMTGYDRNGNGFLDETEASTLFVKDSQGQSVGPAAIRGFSEDQYTGARGVVTAAINSPFPSPLAENLLQIFRDGNPDSIDSGYVPTAALDSILDALFTGSPIANPGNFAEWLTHNGGAAFNSVGVAPIKDYRWDFTKPPALQIATAIQTTTAINALYSSVVAPQAAAYFAANPEAPETEFPLDPNQWFDAMPLYPVLTSFMSDIPGKTVDYYTPLQGPANDLHVSIGRGRLLSHQVRFKVKKFSNGLGVTQVHSTGRVSDLYDFSHPSGGPAAYAAILQIGFGNGSYGGDRNRGKIFKHEIEFKYFHPTLP